MTKLSFSSSYSGNGISISMRNEKRFNFSKTKLIICFTAIFGVVDTLLLLYNHFYTQGQCQVLPLGLNNIVESDCGTVTNSSYGVMLGFPLSLWGLIGYLLIITTTLISFWRGNFFILTLLLAGFGTAVFYLLIWVQYSLIGIWCPLCLISALFMNLIFFTGVYIFIYRPPALPDFSEFGLALLLMLTITLGLLLTYKVYEDYLQKPSMQLEDFDANNSGTDYNINTLSFPAALINNKVVDLIELDYELASHFSTDSLTQLTSRSDLAIVLYHLRERALYMFALKSYSSEQKQDLNKTILTLSGQSINSPEFSDQLYRTKEVITLLERTPAPGNVINTFVLSLPLWYTNFLTNIHKAINIQKNLPSPE